MNPTVKKIFYSRSNDSGITWADKYKVITYDIRQFIYYDNEIDHDKEIMEEFMLFINTGDHYLKYSDDNGISWSESMELPTQNLSYSENCSFRS